MRRKIVLLFGALLVLGAAAATAASAGGTTPDVRLLAAYEPVMQFDPLERFEPTKVQPFLTDAALDGQNLNQTGCSPSASLGGLDCYAAAAARGGGGPTLYGHVVREDGDIVLQYWAFYYDDVYSYTYPASDFIWQAHEGDWESVTVVLSDDEQPLLVGYSQHCLGQRRAWADTTRVGETHPVVHVAFGSHANYFTSGTHPIAISCIPPAAVAILQRNHLPLPVDYSFDGGAVAGPPRSGGRVMPIEQIGDDGPNWVQFPGTWGELQYFHAPAPIGTVPFGTSPLGPAHHPEWSDPLGSLAAFSLSG